MPRTCEKDTGKRGPGSPGSAQHPSLVFNRFTPNFARKRPGKERKNTDYSKLPANVLKARVGCWFFLTLKKLHVPDEPRRSRDAPPRTPSPPAGWAAAPHVPPTGQNGAGGAGGRVFPGPAAARRAPSALPSVRQRRARTALAEATTTRSSAGQLQRRGAAPRAAAGRALLRRGGDGGETAAQAPAAWGRSPSRSLSLSLSPPAAPTSLRTWTPLASAAPQHPRSRAAAARTQAAAGAAAAILPRLLREAPAAAAAGSGLCACSAPPPQGGERGRRLPSLRCPYRLSSCVGAWAKAVYQDWCPCSEQRQALSHVLERPWPCQPVEGLLQIRFLESRGSNGSRSRHRPEHTCAVWLCGR